jgi:hypothetical protein
LGTKAPTLFGLTVSTAGGIRDAAESIAHEMLHISQAVNGRLLITGKKAKINGRKTMVDMARWMGGKPLVMDNLAWHLRPWEIEACHWQTLLVDEFLGMSTGQVTDQPVQSPKRRQLALYPVSMPSLVPTQLEPAFDGVSVNGDSADISSSTANRLDSNGASIDRVITGVTSSDIDQRETTEGPQDRAMPDDPEKMMEPVRNGIDQTASVTEPVRNGIQLPDNMAPLAAMPERPVYPRLVIEVTVPGLDSPRTLEREAMMKKLSEFRERGLAAAADAE